MRAHHDQVDAVLFTRDENAGYEESTGSRTFSIGRFISTTPGDPIRFPIHRPDAARAAPASTAVRPVIARRTSPGS
jgi:hypothetical protein